MSNILNQLCQDIACIEAKNNHQILTKIVSQDVISLLVEWGGLTQRLRDLKSKISDQEFIKHASRLSKLLSSFITKIGMVEDYTPLPEAVLIVKHQKKFDLVESDATTALVYCSHKAIECLAIIASKGV